ncbi:MAG: CsbD family protein [Ramlibacter sp.]
MNKQRITGALKNAAGKAQERAGKAIGSPEQQARGLARQSEGRMEKAYGALKDALKNSRH